MAVKDIDTKVAEKFDPTIEPRSDTGRDLYKQETAADPAFDGMVDFYKKNTANPTTENKHIEAARAQEGNPTRLFSRMPGAKRARRQIFKGVLKGKTSLIALILVLFGGAGMVTIMMSPTLAIVQFKELLVKDLNDQLASYDARQVVLLRGKLKDTTKGSCGVIKIKCKFATMSDRQVKNLEATGKFKITRDPPGLLPNRGMVTKITHTDSNGKVTEYSTAQAFADAQRTDLDFRSDLATRISPLFNSTSDPTWRKVMRKLGVSKTPKIAGDTDEERQKSLNDAVDNKTAPDGKTVTRLTNDKGETIGWEDEDGNRFTDQQVQQANESASRLSSSPTTMKVLSGAAKGVLITGAADTACTVYNTSRAVASLAKLKQTVDAARFANALVLTPADAQKAGAATEEMMNFVGSNLNQVTTEQTVLDENKWNQEGTAAKPPTTSNPELGSNAYDSFGYHLAAYGSAPPLNARAQRFMIGGGMVGTLDGVNQMIARIVNGGDPNPQQVSEKCGYIQNPFVRGGALIVGVIAGAGTFGLSTALMITGSAMVSMALPLIEARLADMIKGDTFKDINGADSGDAAFVGTSATFGEAAKARAMKPLSAEEAVEYTEATKTVNAKYDEIGRYLAKSTPLDVMNQYSFLGSLARQITPAVQSSDTTVASAALQLTASLPFALTSTTSTAKAAASIDRFQHCNDPGYRAIGVGADMFCNIRYGLSREELKMDTFENIDWMVATGNIDGSTDGGDARDNGQSWNYVKFLKECVNRTHGYGEDQEENSENGASCRSEQNEALNKHFRVYTFDKSVDEALDAEPRSAPLPGTEGFGTGETGAVSASGWAFPTVADAVITSGYKSAARPDHRGADIAMRSSDINAAMNKPIFAARDGEVVKAGPADGFGNWIVIRHEIDGKRVDTVYGHMYNDGVLVKVGDKVKAGQQIGKIGSNGQSTGAHLHYEIWDGGRDSGKEIDPTPSLDASRTERRV